jgi:multimeric flavodoxin WrbA
MVSGEYRKPLKWCQPGSIHAFDSINHFFLIGQMIVPGSSYWNMGIGRNKGEVESDEEGLQTMKTLGQNMAWLLKRLHATNIH